MSFRHLAFTAALSLAATTAHADCAFDNEVGLKSLTASFEAWKAVTDAMAECGNFGASLDQEFQQKQVAAFASEPPLYQIGGVANGSFTPLINGGLLRPLDDLVEEYGQHLTPSQLITVDGQIMAIAMMVNTQHLMYREDILDDLGLEVPTNYDEVLAAAEKIEQAGVVDYPLGGTYKIGWDLGQEFANMYLGFGGAFFDENGDPSLNNEQGVATLQMMKKLTEYMDPEYLVSESTFVQRQFQQGKIAMANLWASRAGAMDDPGESQVIGKIKMASAPAAIPGGKPAAQISWNGVVFPKTLDDDTAAAAFRVAMEGLDSEMVEKNNDVAIWIIEGYEPGPAAIGAIETLNNGAVPTPSTVRFGLIHSAVANGIADFLTGKKDAETTLADIEAAYAVDAKEAGLIQ